MMKRVLLTMVVAVAAMLSSSALNFQEAFGMIKNLPDKAGIESQDATVKVFNPISFPIDNMEACLKTGQTPDDTEFYGNYIYSVISQMDPATLAKSYADDQILFSIFAQPSQQNGKHEILVLFDNAQKGFCAAYLGEIAENLYQLLTQSSIIAYDKNGNICLYIEAFGFGGD